MISELITADEVGGKKGEKEMVGELGLDSVGQEGNDKLVEAVINKVEID
jgi:hypothetical protein